MSECPGESYCKPTHLLARLLRRPQCRVLPSFQPRSSQQTSVARPHGWGGERRAVSGTDRDDPVHTESLTLLAASGQVGVSLHTSYLNRGLHWAANGRKRQTFPLTPSNLTRFVFLPSLSWV